MKYLKKVIGIDISKDSFVIRFGTLNNELQQKIGGDFTFKNDLKGFKKFLITLSKIPDYLNNENTPSWFVMEATGVYYENLAYFLNLKNYQVSVLLPNKTKHFNKTLDNKSKTDKLDASALAQFGLEKQLKAWTPPSAIMKDIKELTREYHNLVVMSTQTKNKIHAKNYSYKPSKENVKRLTQQVNLLKKQITQVKKQLEDLVKSDEELYDKIKKIMTVKGLGFLTVVSVVSETNGFILFKNIKQLTSFAGYDVVHNQSGTITGKTKISKKGNKFIRNALYFPALTAVRCDDKFKSFYKRLCVKKVYKKIALVAVSRKLLALIYTLWKKNEEYIPNYNKA
jgi:transposase